MSAKDANGSAVASDRSQELVAGAGTFLCVRGVPRIELRALSVLAAAAGMSREAYLRGLLSEHVFASWGFQSTEQVG